MATGGSVVLAILDGWGIGPDDPGNAVLAARTPTMDHLQRAYPTTALRTSGRDVGLPEGQMGNSEVGHLNLGAGYVVHQWITRIDLAIENRTFFENPAFHEAVRHVRERGSALHLLGLLGDGGVHAHQRHLTALLELARRERLERVFIHAFTDGRDTPPDSGLGFMEALARETERLGVGQVATVIGRYYAMDRDRRWERTRRAYAAIVHGEGARFRDPLQAIRASYAAGVTDEFVEPVVIESASGEAVATLRSGDAAIFLNFRGDRVRQITDALITPEVAGLPAGDRLADLCLVTMTQYDPELPARVAFPPENVEYPLARVVAEASLRQFHTAETEKYPHVTYFFNGGREEPFPGEDRHLVPSPKVPTYDLKPEMSAFEVTDALVRAIERRDYAFIIVNYANGDMVGHTGVFAAAVAAIEAVDTCLARVIDATLASGGVAIVTADHGNAEEMLVPGTDEVWTAHTTNPVPLVLVTPEGHPLRQARLRAGGRLADVAPTVLQIMGLPRPQQMTGTPLIEQP